MNSNQTLASHTFLFQEGKWIANGIYTDSENQTYPTNGHTRIVHEEQIWILDGYMTVRKDGELLEFRNQYHIEPVTQNRQTTSWTSSNPALGEFQGIFTFIGDAILSIYSSNDEEYTGVECLIQENDETYKTRGILLQGDKTISSWAVTLTQA